MSRNANRLAKSIHEESENTRKCEARFIAAYLYAEILNAQNAAGGWLSTVEAGDPFRLLAFDIVTKQNVFGLLNNIDLPLSQERFDRLHVLDEEVGSSLARALGTIALVRLAVPRLVVAPDDEDGKLFVTATLGHVQSVYDDLAVVLEASRSARWPA